MILSILWNLLNIIIRLFLGYISSNPVPGHKELTPEQAKRLALWTPQEKEPMWQISGQLEGDMVEIGNAIAFNGVKDTEKLWKNKEIPYELSNDFSADQKKHIRNVLETEYAKTCIKIRPRNLTDIDYVYVTGTTGERGGCWSYVGRLGFKQILNLDVRGCVVIGAIVHEFLHAAGFEHQHSASNRDDYVTIVWNNIKAGQEHAFRKMDGTSFGEKYDYGSIMHYNKYAFSANGQPTILTKDPKAKIGQLDGLSPLDIVKLNKMYGCT